MIASWETKGLICIADPTPKSECLKTSSLPLDFNESYISLSRNINPVKIYAQTVTKISTPTAVQLTLGASYEPILADIIQVLDQFTKPTIDPSPPIGWWDKLRHVFHGNNIVQITSGCFAIRVLGSTSPYYDAKRHFGSNGLDIQFRDTVEFQIGGRKENTQVIITCGEFKAALPDAKLSSKYTNSFDTSHRTNDIEILATKIPPEQTYEELCIAKLSGSVCITVSIDFLTKNLNLNAGDDSSESSEIKPWKQHNDIVLRTPENCPYQKRVLYANNRNGTHMKDSGHQACTFA